MICTSDMIFANASQLYIYTGNAFYSNCRPYDVIAPYILLSDTFVLDLSLKYCSMSSKVFPYVSGTQTTVKIMRITVSPVHVRNTNPVPIRSCSNGTSDTTPNLTRPARTAMAPLPKPLALDGNISPAINIVT